MRIYDISVPISGDTPVYPGDPAVEIIPVSRISEGGGANVSLLKLGSHTGTHVDPPCHFVEGAATLDEVPLEVFVGECLVCEIPDAETIGVAELEAAGIPEGTERVLFKTRNSDLWGRPGFQEDYVYITPDAAGLLADRGLRLVGVDYLSVEGFLADPAETHVRFLKAGVLLVEGLDLREVAPGKYTLVCLPLRIARGDGGPARAILIDGDL